MPPKRKQGRDLPPNLYQSTDKRDGVTRYRYRDPRSGRFHGLGTDKAAAVADAKALNAAIYSGMASRVDSIAQTVADTPKLSAVILKHIELAEALVKRGKMKQSTVDGKHAKTKPLLEKLGHRPIGEITVLDLAELIDGYIDQGKERMASLIRSEAAQVWKTAMAKGWATDNIPERTLAVNPETKRQRMTLEQFKAVYEQADGWLRRAMELALVTAQRRGDIVAMEFRQREGATAWVQDGSLWVIQGKGRDSDKRHVCIPLALKLDAVGWTLGDIVAKCRNRTVSKYLVHQERAGSEGDALAGNSVSESFSEARKQAGFVMANPFTFHEIRSLSARLYAAQGVDVQALLGHKQASTTEIYRDVRGSEWIKVSA